MVKIEVDLPIQIHGFLTAAAKFAEVLDDEKHIEEYIQNYIVDAMTQSVQHDAGEISTTPLWTRQDLEVKYGLHEPEADS